MGGGVMFVTGVFVLGFCGCLNWSQAVRDGRVIGRNSRSEIVILFIGCDYMADCEERLCQISAE